MESLSSTAFVIGAVVTIAYYGYLAWMVANIADDIKAIRKKFVDEEQES